MLSKKAGNLCQKSRPIVQNTGGEKFVRNLLIVLLHVIVNLLFSKLSKVFKGRTIRYLRGGGLGNFSGHEFFFIPELLAIIFFSATFLCTIFFLDDLKKFSRTVRRKVRRRGGSRGINFSDCRKNTILMF